MYFKAALLAVALSHVLPAVSVVHEKLDAIPATWTVAATSPSNDTMITLSIGLAQQNIDQLESRLIAVSTPGSKFYGQHLSRNNADSLFASSDEAKAAVKFWLRSAGLSSSSISSNGDWITITATIGKANALLNTTFTMYESNGVSKLRTTQYSIPENLTQHIDLITPTTYFGKIVANLPVKPRAKRDSVSIERPVDHSCATTVTPSCIKDIYNIGNYTPKVSSGSRIGFSSFLRSSAHYAELSQFEAYFGIPPQNLSKVLINGGINNQDNSLGAGYEANLDAQTIIGVSHPLPVTEFITGGSPPIVPYLEEPAGINYNEPWLDYLQFLLSQPNSAIPQVISNSYADYESSVPKPYAIRVCNMIGLLGLRGISVLSSSGDIGVGSACRSADGKNTTRFEPQFPASCPYITSVGGTTSVAPEVAWSTDYGSGLITSSSGGFSSYFSRPLYQKPAVGNYLDNHISAVTKSYYAPLANFAGRGIPDISAQGGYNYLSFSNGKIDINGGTSASTPVVASIIALLNDARFRTGKSSLGFINPLLYYFGYNALNDITSGGSAGCTGTSLHSGETLPGAGIVPWASWNATVGWDPVTGLGTPNFQALKTLVLKF